MSTQNTNTLFTNALNTVNTAIGAHADETPYKQILEKAEQILDDRNLGVAVYKDDPATPHDYFTVTFDHGAFTVVARGKQDPDVDGKVSVDYLEELAENPERYVENPLKLDIDWLTSRLGLS